MSFIEIQRDFKTWASKKPNRIGASGSHSLRRSSIAAFIDAGVKLCRLRSSIKPQEISMTSKAFSQKRKSEQLSLYKQSEEPLPENYIASSFNDPAFASNKRSPIHRWVPWIAGFSSEFVRNVLDQYLTCESTVLDPFAGVGTTLVEAVLAGHNAIGFEINPYAALACNIKANVYNIDAEALREEVGRLGAFCDEASASGYIPASVAPAGFKTRAEFYSPNVLHKVLVIQDFIVAIKERSVQDLFRLAFASTMVRYSNYSYEPSLGRRASSGKPDVIDFPVVETILNKLGEMVEDIKDCQTATRKNRPDVRIINRSFFEHQNHLAPDSVDLIVTSPPYLNNYHYNRNTRPQLYWLGFVSRPDDLRHLEETNFGKFWQTVRERDCLDLLPALQETEIAKKLEELRALNPEKGIYGGNGWANYAAAYFNDCYLFAEAINKVLKPGAIALVVIGNSILQGIFIPTDHHLAQIAEMVGLRVVKIDVPRATRVGNSIIQSDVRVTKAQKSHQLYEAVVVLQRQ